jgi:hypothetical protein
MSTSVSRWRGLSIAAVSILAFSQCSRTELSTPLAPSAVTAPASSAVVGANEGENAEFGKLKVCKTGNVAGTFSLQVQEQGGTRTTTVGPSFTLQPGECRTVAENFSPSGSGAQITLTETSAGLRNISGERIDANPTRTSADNPPNGAVSRFLNQFHGFRFTFHNVAPPPPPPSGNQGCTPGYWKQSQHFDSWPNPPYRTDTPFASVFEKGIFNGTLLQALGANGGGKNALARHAAAALLNAQSPDVAYKYTVSEVIAITNGEAPYNKLTVEQRKNLLEAANESGCPLN